MDEDKFDETYVKPVLAAALPDNGELFHVGLELRTAGGLTRPGCVEFFDGAYRFPATFHKDELCDLEPQGSQTYLEVNGVLDPDIERAWVKQMVSVFEQPFDIIFAIKWKLRVPHSNRRRAGSGVIAFIPHKGCELKEDDV